MKKALLFGALTALLLGCNNAPKQKESTKDNEAYKACLSISDYRAYMRTYGTNGLHYNEAKNVVDRYVADSITKAEATTIAACENYLKAYPHGRYVYEVEEIKAELEKKASVQADKLEEEAYKKCTTVAGCRNYLRTYPNGKYAGVVNKKTAELEKKENEEASNKNSTKTSTTKKQEVKTDKDNTKTTPGKPKNDQNKDNKANAKPKATKIKK